MLQTVLVPRLKWEGSGAETGLGRPGTLQRDGERHSRRQEAGCETGCFQGSKQVTLRGDLMFPGFSRGEGREWNSRKRTQLSQRGF